MTSLVCFNKEVDSRWARNWVYLWFRWVLLYPHSRYWS